MVYNKILKFSEQRKLALFHSYRIKIIPLHSEWEYNSLPQQLQLRKMKRLPDFGRFATML